MPKYETKATKTVADYACVSLRNMEQGLMRTNAFETELKDPQCSVKFNL